MRKILLGVVAAATLASPLALAASANATQSPLPSTTTQSDAANCAPVTEVPGYVETLYKYVPAGKTSDGPTQWDGAQVPAGTSKTFTVKGKSVDYVSDGRTSVTTYPSVDGVTCVVGEPQPKVLPIPGVDNDQIYENPSEQYVPHITGHVSRGWGNGTADITYVTDGPGYVFANGETTKVVTVNEIDQSNIVIALPANPLSLTLAQPADTEQYSWSKVVDHSFGSSDRGVNNGLLGITVTAKPGYVFKNGTGTLASKTFTLANVYMFSYTDNFGSVTCHEIQGATSDAVACTFNGFTRPAGEQGTSPWQSDFVNNTRTGLGTLTYTVNDAGTGYTGTVTY